MQFVVRQSFSALYLEFTFVLFPQPPDSLREFLLDFFPSACHFRLQPVHSTIELFVSLALELSYKIVGSIYLLYF